MKPIILYHSQTGNTEKILSGPAASGDIDIVAADKAALEHLRGRTLVGLASGIYWGKHHSSLFRAARKIPDTSRVFVISSSGFKSPFLIRVYTFLLTSWLKMLRLDLVGQWHCPGHDQSKDPLFRWLALSKGRPNQKDIDNLRAFIRTLTENHDNLKREAPNKQ
jgi:hypothetical protein